MSSTDVNYHFKQFGSKMQTLGILALLSFIFGLIANFVAVVGIINFIILIITLIVLFSALGEAKEAGYKLNNRLLIEFRSKIVTAFILFLVGYFFLIGGTIGLAAVLIYTESIAAV
ncbi:MAG: hypothetical protein GF383_14450, partial [Candidatus Lokiarchaeota archaeon]|nr:hypothetical protein [Candidatus Lokiarchaeota archaeon]MBD3342591.1 hypothetical protein [Candidatus Lokiarchaeota archaeon]